MIVDRETRQIERLKCMRKLRQKTCKLKTSKPESKRKKRREIDVSQLNRPRIYSDGTVVYPKRGWEPPPVPEGYVRKTKNLRSLDAWKFVPKFKLCSHRVFKEGEKSCGCVTMLLHCNRSGELVKINEAQCQDCESLDRVKE